MISFDYFWKTVSKYHHFFEKWTEDYSLCEITINLRFVSNISGQTKNTLHCILYDTITLSLRYLLLRCLDVQSGITVNCEQSKHWEYVCGWKSQTQSGYRVPVPKLVHTAIPYRAVHPHTLYCNTLALVLHSCLCIRIQFTNIDTRYLTRTPTVTTALRTKRRYKYETCANGSKSITSASVWRYANVWSVRPYIKDLKAAQELSSEIHYQLVNVHWSKNRCVCDDIFLENVGVIWMDTTHVSLIWGHGASCISLCNTTRTFNERGPNDCFSVIPAVNDTSYPNMYIEQHDWHVEGLFDRGIETKYVFRYY